MPVEIRELVIRAVVDTSEDEAATREHDLESIIATCVREVLKVLERGRER